LIQEPSGKPVEYLKGIETERGLKEVPEEEIIKGYKYTKPTTSSDAAIQLGTALNLLESDAASNLVEHPFLTDVCRMASNSPFNLVYSAIRAGSFAIKAVGQRTTGAPEGGTISQACLLSSRSPRRLKALSETSAAVSASCLQLS
jgi:hypothetical protein